MSALKRFTQCGSLTMLFGVFIVLFGVSSTALTTFGKAPPPPPAPPAGISIIFLLLLLNQGITKNSENETQKLIFPSQKLRRIELEVIFFTIIHYFLQIFVLN